MTRQWTALAWEQEYDRIYPGSLNPHRNAALGPVGDVFEALGRAQVRAEQAQRAGRAPYTGRLGFARRNLLECWFWVAELKQLDPHPEAELARARKLLRHVKAQYRQLRNQQSCGIAGRLDGWAA